MNNAAIIFDHDGTLVDSLEAVIICTNISLKNFGFSTCSEEEVIKGMALPTGERFESHTGCGDRRIIDGISADFYSRMHEEGLDHLRVYDGVPEMLDQLKNEGYRLGMVSNNQGLFIRRASVKLDYSNELAVILGEEDIAATKPAPDGLLQACAGLGADTGNSWYIGDAVSDFRAAKAAGMRCGLVSWGAHPEAELAECGADVIFRSPEEIGRYFRPS